MFRVARCWLLGSVILLAPRFLALLPGCEGREEGNTGFRTGEFGTLQGVLQAAIRLFAPTEW